MATATMEVAGALKRDEMEKETENLKHLTTRFQGIPKEYNQTVQDFVRPHIESFNFIQTGGLAFAIQDIPPQEFALPDGTRIMLAFKDAQISKPSLLPSLYTKDLRVFPSECRLKRATYSGKLHVFVSCSINGKLMPTAEVFAGDIPIMVKTNCCHLSKLSPEELVKRHEEAQDFGGYFIVNGIEKIARMLIIPRGNYPMVIQRPSWRKLGNLFSDYGISIRCVKPDRSAMQMTLHYLTNGTAKLSFTYMREQFFVPVILILKALCDLTDHDIYRELIKGRKNDSNYHQCIKTMMRQLHEEGIYNQNHALDYIGSKFRHVVRRPEWDSNAQIANFLLKQCVCIHLESNRDKFNLLVYMTKKLFSVVVSEEYSLESADSTMNHDVLLAGHLYLMILKAKLDNWLNILRFIITKAVSSASSTTLNQRTLHKIITTKPPSLTRGMENFLATGNIPATNGLALMQTSGLTIVADKLNYLRYISHFRSIHRGSFFQEMRTTTPRKLLPESWGFICPVHTPDGAPCGLLNHLASLCQVVPIDSPATHLLKVLCGLGMTPVDVPFVAPYDDSYTVQLNGRFLGYVPSELVHSFVDELRYLKVTDNSKVPPFLEICFVPIRAGLIGQYPGIFLFSSAARMMRPVLNLVSNSVEFIGTFEQVYLDIAVNPKEVHKGITKHMELSETGILSALANLIPLPDFNQSPRNMYQCQMGKQTMGTPCTALRYRTDNKLYRIMTPQAPFFRTDPYGKYGIDDYPLGTNAIVAVISYTGYDMEDAMILNKSSLERGFASGVVYKTEVVTPSKGKIPTHKFGLKQGDTSLDGRLDRDGLPFVGKLLRSGDPFYCTVDLNTGEQRVQKYKLDEAAYVDDVICVGPESGNAECQTVCIRLRIPRNPVIGDKFASRHGQKGICSQKYPQVDMPFTESGMVPDIIFNPHGFPSRMTIGMMIECMAGKSSCLHGIVHDATPFKFSEEDPASDYFGKLLEAAGYNYYGTERMYSGTDGREMNADIFFGVVYYQRLRHMVADKFQVRSTGPVDRITRQPIKGRKRGGGIRFGEMERDSLLAHGTAFLLKDRLFNCSDGCFEEHVCTKCGSILSPILRVPTTAMSSDAEKVLTCSVCETGRYIEVIALPHVFRYFTAELAAVNIKVFLKCKV